VEKEFRYFSPLGMTYVEGERNCCLFIATLICNWFGPIRGEEEERVF